ncbi:MAG: hypothetical protein K0U78_15110 [Actinomycetia bacterium]|nr:hypothetical protein [Actinomycetes bacterium]
MKNFVIRTLMFMIFFIGYFDDEINVVSVGFIMCLILLFISELKVVEIKKECKHSNERLEEMRNAYKELELGMINGTIKN